jgi:hypothetical protein
MLPFQLEVYQYVGCAGAGNCHAAISPCFDFLHWLKNDLIVSAGPFALCCIQPVAEKAQHCRILTSDKSCPSRLAELASLKL